jgi:hypothetical protein
LGIHSSGAFEKEYGMASYHCMFKEHDVAFLGVNGHRSSRMIYIDHQWKGVGGRLCIGTFGLCIDI